MLKMFDKKSLLQKKQKKKFRGTKSNGVQRDSNIETSDKIIDRARRILIEFFRSKGTKNVYIRTARDDKVCPFCQKWGERGYSLSRYPKLPFKHCTNPEGCRCNYIPIE